MTKLLWAGSALAIVAFASATGADAQSRSRARPAAAATPAAAAPATASPAAARAPQTPPQITLTYASASAMAGVCVVDTGRAVENSRVGVASQRRLAELSAPIQADLTTKEQAVEKLTGDERAKQGRALELLAAQRSLQLASTRNGVIGKINAAVAGALPAVFKQRSCSILLKSDTVVSSTQVTGPNAATATIYAAAGNDITSALSAQIDATLPALTFELDPMPTEAQAQQALQQLQQQRQQQQQQ